MNNQQVGQLIMTMRKEKQMTQKALGDILKVSDKTISKWERGMGYPDISFVNELAHLLGINVENLLEGNLAPNLKDVGNLSKVNFYVCPQCGNMMYGTGSPDLSCCGRKLMPLEIMADDEGHALEIEPCENDYWIQLNHEMTKDHYISFVAHVFYDRILLVKLYPEQAAQVRIPRRYKGMLYYYCNQHGLRRQLIK